MKRYATATWAGPGKDGSGLLSTQSARLTEVPYSFTSRFEDTPDTNPEELIAAAHASCFTMKLSFVLGEAGYVPQLLETRCTILFEQGAITGSELALRARIPGISKAALLDSVKDAEVNCPVSRVLSCKISVQVLLEEA